MPQITVIGKVSAAVAYTATATYQNAGATATFNPPQPVHTAGYKHVIVSSDVLAGAEEVDIYFVSGGTVKTVTDTTGTAKKLTASINVLLLEAGPTYLFSKDATASDCGVYVDLVPES